MNQQNNQNLIIAVVLCLAILLGFQYFYEMPRLEKKQAEKEKVLSEQDTRPSADASMALSPSPAFAPQGIIARRVAIETPYLQGSISLQGGRIDDLVLRKYKDTLNTDSPDVTLLAPQGHENPYYAEFGWVSNNKSVLVPGAMTNWHFEGEKLTPDTPIKLVWHNGQGLTFEKEISVDEHYAFTVRQRVVNHSSTAVELNAYGLISRGGKPPVSDFFILYEGPIGYLDGKLREHTYKDLVEDGPSLYKSQGGWIGMTDKYWLTALIPDQRSDVKANFSSFKSQSGQIKYQSDILSHSHYLAPNQSIEETTHFFAGAKSLELLDAYEKTLPAPHFDLAVDFGWFYFITKPIFYALTYFHGYLGNFGLAILLLTILMRLLFFPLSSKAYRSMAKMRTLQPQIAQLKEKHANDKASFHEATMAFYKKHKINPVSGCLPFVVQIPVFFALYKVLFITLEMRHAPFYGWIHDLSAPDPTTLFNLFGLLPFTPPSFLMIGVWPILMGITMFVQQKLNPQPMDAVQEKIFLFLPFMFVFLLGSFPAGLVIYWTWSNVLAIGQQLLISRMAHKSNLKHSRT